MLHALHEFAGTERFEVLSQLGMGGMGIVYRVFDREQRRQVALKTLRSFSALALLRFKNEFRILQDLQHPNLVSLGELIEEGGHWFFTTDLVDGVDFLRYVRGSSGSTRGHVTAEIEPDPSPASQRVCRWVRDLRSSGSDF